METTQEITKFVPILSIVESYQAARRETEEASSRKTASTYGD